jgi:DNA-binding SARP family transcriptional activator/tetratricopeptide (TPR) repeat protein
MVPRDLRGLSAQDFSHMVHLRTLGELRLEAARAPALSSRRKELVLLAYLARRGSRSLGRAEAAALLWPDRDERRARQSLRQALLELRQAVGDGLVVENEVIRLEPGSIELDASALERAVEEGRPAVAVELWRGEFLAGAEDVGGEELRAWLEAEREGLRRRLALAFGDLVEGARRQGAWREGSGWAERWVAALPLDQRGHLQLLRLLHLQGRGSEALSRWATLQAQLRGLELEPIPELAHLVGQLERSADPDQRALPRAAALAAPELIGRGAALAELDAAWREVKRGSAAIVLLEGEPGAGRTRLCREFLRGLERASERHLLLEARRGQDVIAQLGAGLAPAPGLAGAPASALAVLAARSPDIAARFPQGEERRPTPHEVATALREALVAVAEETRVVVLADDLPQLDEDSRAVLSALAESSPQGTLLLATALSGTGPATSLPSASAVRRVRLQPLSDEEVELLLASMVDLPQNQRRRLASALHRHTGGNPFYTVETISALADDGTLLPGDGGAWRVAREGQLSISPAVREAVSARLAGLTPAGRRTLEAAAVLGIPFDRELLAEVAGAAFAIDAALEELVRARVVREGEAGKHEIAADLLRRQVELGVSAGRGESLSAQAVAALERRGPNAETDTALRHHRARAAKITASRRRKSLLRLGAAVAAIAAITLAMVFRRGTGPASVSSVAVLPFSVSGTPELAYLRDGMASLLSTQLDGSGSLRSVDPRAVLGMAAQVGAGSPAAELGRRVADRLGAGTYVVGDIVEAQGRIRITAAAYRAGAAGPPIARAEVEGNTAQLFELVDGIAGRLLTGLSRGPYEQLTRVAATTTGSLPALKAYLDGERLFRQGDFQPASRAFQRAIVEDTTFGLAYYWLSVASWWADDSEGIDSAAAFAVRYGGRLPDRYRRLFLAWEAFLRGDPIEAERIYRQVVELEPENVEAWLQLGEVRFHSGPRRGYRMGTARQAFERVLYFEPEHTSALLHLARIAANESRLPELDSLTRTILELSPAGEWAVEARALRSFAVGDVAEQRQVIDELRTAGEGRVWNIARYLAIAAHSLEGADRVLRLLTEPTRSPEVRAFGHLALAHLELARGRIKAADGQLERASSLDPVAALQHRALLATVPFLPAEPGALRALLDTVIDPRPRRALPNLETSHLANLHDIVEDELRAYLAAGLSVRLGDTTAARRYVAGLAASRGSPARAAVAADALGSIRAQVALRAGQGPEAIRDLQEVLRLEARVGLIGGSPFYSQGLERFLYAGALTDAGRLQEAALWYDSFSSNSIFDLIYLAPAGLARGRLAEQLGDVKGALGYYQQVVALWLGCDQQVRAIPDSARRRISALSSEVAVRTSVPSTQRAPRGSARGAH